jgi:YagB/YeeU/YfjZ family.
MSNKIPAENHDITQPWWGLKRSITPCFGARLVQEGNRLHYLADRADTRHNIAAQDVTGEAEHALSEALYDLAHWLYCQLQSEYRWLASPAAVDEAIMANDYTFTESGMHFG